MNQLITSSFELNSILNKHKLKFFLGIVAGYLTLSFYKIGVNSLWFDECFSIDLGNDTIREIINYSIYNDTNPPIYLLVVHYWMKVFGNSETALRSISAISMSFACGIFFLLSLRFFNWQAAIFSVLLFFVSNDLFFYSQEGRTYGLILLLCVSSNYLFLQLIKKPNLFVAILLGLLNIAIFYTHTLGTINAIGQIILAPILGFNFEHFKNKTTEFVTYFGFRIKTVIYYCISWIVFVICFWPWKERFIGIIEDGAKGFWLQKPTIREYRETLYELYNTEYLFYTFLAINIILLLILIFVKKYRNENFKFQLLLIPLILGPFLFHFNYFAASITPIFLKRYVLFTFLGFILTFAFLLSSIKFRFRYKFALVVVLGVLLVRTMKVPREIYWDYRAGAAYVKSIVSPTTYVSTENMMLLAYYYDRKGAFKEYQPGRMAILARSNIYENYPNTWVETTDLSKYRNIYYMRSFSGYMDPEGKIIKELNSRYKFIEEVQFPGLQISHYANIDSVELNQIKQKIRSDVNWFNDVKTKAAQRNITIEEMIELDANWVYNQRYKIK